MRIISTIFLFIFFMSVGFASDPLTTASTDKSQAQQEKPENKHISQKPPAPSKTEPPKSLNQEPALKKQMNNFWYSSSEWWMVVVTGVLVLVTAVLAWFTSRLYKATVVLSKEAQNTTKRLTSIERPWLFIEKVRVERREGAPIQPELSNNWYISFIWRNIGRSPALIEECAFKIKETNTLSETPDYLDAGHLTCPSSVAAGIEFETSQVGPGSKKKRERDGKPINLTIFGRLTYKELNGELHHTGFAMDVSPHLPAANTSKFKKYEYYN